MPELQTFEQVVHDLAAANGQMEEVIKGCARLGPKGEVIDWDLKYLGLRELPASFCCLPVAKDVNLCKNQLETLPDNLGNLTIGGPALTLILAVART